MKAKKKLNRDEPQPDTSVIMNWNTRLHIELMKGKKFPFTSNSQIYDKRIKRFQSGVGRKAA